MVAPTPPPADADEQARALCQALNAFAANKSIVDESAARAAVTEVSAE